MLEPCYCPERTNELTQAADKPAHTKPGALLKAEDIHRAAIELKSLGILTTTDMHTEYGKDPEHKKIKKAWLDLPSQSSGVTFNYLLILAGFQSVKPDRMVIIFVEEHTGLCGRRLSPSRRQT